MDTAEENISTIIEGCIKNDRKAQALLYRKFYVTMAALCSRYINNRQDAMQVLNDGFLKVFQNIQSYNPAKAGLSIWIGKIMINTAINTLRKRKMTFASDTSVLEEESAIESNSIQELEADELRSIIWKLPKATQLVFNLYTLDGFSHREIGEMLDISEGTSRWHVSEARKELKKSIAFFQNTK